MSLNSVTADPSVERLNYHLLTPTELEKLDDIEALFIRGDRMYDGVGTAKDEEGGWKLIMEAAKRGHSVALGLCIQFEKDATKNSALAASLYKRSAKHGHAIGNLQCSLCFFAIPVCC